MSIHLKHLTLIMILMLAKPVSAFEWGVTDVIGTSQYLRGEVWSGRFQSYNGAFYDASNLYERKNISVTMQQTFYVAVDDLVIFSPTHFDTGYKSDLFTSQPVFAVGLGVQKKLSNATLEIVGRNLLQIGGETSERPCVDSFKRRYHCGVGVSWSDASSARLDHDLTPTFNIIIRHPF